MRRRTVVLGGAASAMLAAVPVRAQQPGRTYKIGILMPASGLGAAAHISAAREQLASHGFVDGRNLSIEVRHPSAFGPSAGAAAARELLALKPDAILTLGTALTRAALAAAKTPVPIIFTWVGDPLAYGLVKDLGRPGANVTGVTNRFFDLFVKRLELARELLPSANRVAMIAGFFDSVLRRGMDLAHPVADRLGFNLVEVEAGGGWGGVIKRSIDAGAQIALVLTPFAAFGMGLTGEDVVRQTIAHRYPVILADVEAVEGGGLMSYATRFDDEVRRAADLLARVLRGAKPGELAVDQASRFELAINLKTSRAIGLKMPQSLLIRADRVIQ